MEMSEELNIVVTQKIHAGKEIEFETLLQEMEAMTIANDKGCLRYEWYRAEQPQTYILLERWTDRAAVQAHLQAPHMVAIMQKIEPLVPGKFTFERLAKI
jgi:quinol monooxygenase YgiN